jgi:hypothetical protein
MSKVPTRSGQIRIAISMQLVTVLLSLFVVSAVSFYFSGAVSALSQGYQSKDSSLQDGMVVRLSSSSTPSRLVVEATDSTSKSPPLGVASHLSDNLLSVGSAVNDIFVTTSGKANAYVADLNGEVKKGDFLSVSPLSGVLQKVSGSGQTVVGSALEDFPSSKAKATSIKGENGQDKSAMIALMSINIDIKPVGQARVEDNFLQAIGKTITGHSVNEVRVLAAFMIFIALLVVEGVVVHGTITSTISAAGRNPMARGFIEQQSFKGVLIAIIVLLTSVATISIILWA